MAIPIVQRPSSARSASQIGKASGVLSDPAAGRRVWRLITIAARVGRKPRQLDDFSRGFAAASAARCRSLARLHGADTTAVSH